MLALNEALGEVYGALVVLAEGDHEKLVDLEKQHLKTDHSQVSAWITSQWHLPDLYSLSVQASHDYKAVEEVEEIDSIVRCVNLSGYVADIWISAEVPKQSELAFKKAQELLNFDQETFERVLDQISAALPEVSQVFEVEFHSQQEIDQIMDSAREALLSISLQAAEEVRKQEAIVVSLSSRNRRLEQKSQKDGLTQLYNRAYFDEAFLEEFKTANLAGMPLSVVLCDVDHFKRLNDTHGHQVGDMVLRKVAKLIGDSIRRRDLAARYGGEEFVLILVDADASIAARVSERMRKSIESTAFTIDDGRELRITVSAGHATHTVDQPFKRPSQLVRAADECLYTAKREGRNRVVGHDPVGRKAQAS
jgi:diguanylate cyclase (GGDEF)-like protein